MRVHVYIDGFNLYFGGKALAGGAQGWKWLNLRAMAQTLVVRRWPPATVDRLVYCTARVKAVTNRTSQRDQDVYLKALGAGSAVDHIEYGKFYEKVKMRPVALPDRNRRPVLVSSRAPLLVKDAADAPVP